MSDLSPTDARARYRDLVTKVDATFAGIHGRQRDAMRCGRGCAACCKPQLTVCAVENAAITEYLSAHPEVKPNQRKDACVMLDTNDACMIYPVRPLVCRSHGVPLTFNDRGEERRDVCPLNFTAIPIESLPPSDCINLDTLNTLLALINKAYAPTASLARFPLDPSAV